MKIAKTLLFVCVIINSHNSMAVCTSSDLVGTWITYGDHRQYHTDSSHSGVINCKLIILASGQALSNNSSCFYFYTDWKSNLKLSQTLTGKLSIDSNCHVTGSIRIGSESRAVDAMIGKGKDSIVGLTWDSSVVLNSLQYTFSGVKQ